MFSEIYFSCQFENSMCGIEGNNWTMTTGGTILLNTGPTLGYLSNYYIYANSANTKRGNQLELVY